MSFGYGTGEFEVTSERLGCYRPEEHIDNPKDYADNIDARQYDRRLRGPVDERVELGIDERTGMKNYIASENLGITTSSGLVRNLFGKAIDLGRRYKETKDDKDFYEALRLLGTGCHCLEDFSAHSNYTELALIELGERDIFPHVGRDTQMRLDGARNSVFPIITGTFGGVDFLHSVMGEFNDKATQSELEELEGAISHAKNSDTSLLKDILKKVPSGVFGSDEDQGKKADELQANATASQMQNMQITPKEPEEFTKQIQEIMKQVYPIIEFHDNIMKGISSAIDKIPILPDILEQLQDQVNLFVFSLLAPYIMPVISQVKNELHTGSSEVIKSSEDHQMAVFSDDNDTNPTHSMLSKDHFSNVLNEPAGKVASAVLKWVVPQIVECWDDEDADITRTLDRIVTGVLHHPALREYGDDGARDGRGLMFREVEKWWGDKNEREREALRRSLSREGVQHFKNHKEGVHDKGHGCGKPLGLPTSETYGSSGATGGKSSDAGNLLGGIASALGNSQGSGGSGNYGGSKKQDVIGEKVSEAVGGGAIGSIVGGFASNILGNAAAASKTKVHHSYDEDEDDNNKSSGYNQGGSSYNSNQQSGSSYNQGGSYGGSNQQSSGYGQSDSYNKPSQQSSGYGQSDSYGSNQQSSGYGQSGSYGSNQQSSGYGQSDSYGSNQQSSGYGQSGYNSGSTQASHVPGGFSSGEDRYSQTQTSSSQYPSSGRRGEDQQYGQDSHSGRTGYGSQQTSESRYEQPSGRRHENEGRSNQSHHGSSRRDDSDDDDSNDDDDYEKKQRKREKKEQKRLKKQREEEERRGSSRRDDDNYPSQQPAYGEEQSYSSGGYGRQSGSSRQEESSYSQSSSRYEQTSSSSRYEESSSSGYPGNTQSSSGGYGSTTSGGYGSSSGYGNDSSNTYGSSSGRNEEYGRSSGRRGDSEDMPGSFGGSGGRDDDDDDRRRRHGGGGNSGYGDSGYGNSGYEGGSGGGYGSRY
jgi:hypothetical protein